MKYDELVSSYQKKKESFYRDPASAYIEPFKIAGNVYYVGDKQVCVHLIDSGDGLILIDSGFPHTVFMLFDSIWRLGFRPEDVKYILHSHGHYDHFGASAVFKRLYGTKLCISRVDYEMLARCPQAACLKHCEIVTPMLEVPEFDILLEDGDVLELGNVKIRSVLYPGHTPGNMGFFFDTCEGGEILRVGSFGGVGAGSVKPCALREYGIEENLVKMMLESVEKARSEQVDVVLGNHPYNNHTLEKRQLQLQQGGNPFVDAEMWQSLLDKTKISFEKILAEDSND